ncbi:MAG: hypothetical protein DWQ19_08945 [Crenarchaeota archaeon]|nr:MAG: hypothetical protein DWQ19_08945 [Thermoproteota archaeon]
MHFYKVVCKKNDKYLSVLEATSVYEKEKNYIKEYKIGEWTKPIGNSKLFVFKEWGDAAKFFSNVLVFFRCEFDIFKCEAVKPRPTGYTAGYTGLGKFVEFENFWNKKMWKEPKWNFLKIFQRKTNVSTAPAPKGTYVCDAVKLIEPAQLIPKNSKLAKLSDDYDYWGDVKHLFNYMRENENV